MMNFLERMLGTGAPSAAAGRLRVRLGADLELGRREVPAVVSGTVSADADPSPSMAGGTVTLRTAAGEPVGTVTTGSDGTFSFADVADGQYRIVVSGPDLVDEGGSPTEGYSAVFAVADGTPGPALQAADLQTDPSGSGVGAVLTVVRQADPSGSGLDEVLAAVRADVFVTAPIPKPSGATFNFSTATTGKDYVLQVRIYKVDENGKTVAQASADVQVTFLDTTLDITAKVRDALQGAGQNVLVKFDPLKPKELSLLEARQQPITAITIANFDAAGNLLANSSGPTLIKTVKTHVTVNFQEVPGGNPPAY